MKEKGRQMMCFKKKKDGNGMVPTRINSQLLASLTFVSLVLELSFHYLILSYSYTLRAFSEHFGIKFRFGERGKGKQESVRKQLDQ